MELNKLYNENCLHTLLRMPNNFLDLTVTSPPYDDLREYKGFNLPFRHIARHLFRTTKEGGIVVWVVGDQTNNGSESGTSYRQALFFMECGFFLHDTMIYEKQSPAYPANEKSNRYGQVFEFMFVFSKGKPKTVNLLKDKKNRWAGVKPFGQQTERMKTGELKMRDLRNEIPLFSYRYNIWRYNSGSGNSTVDEIAFKHPAIFPEKLAADHIYTWSNKGDIVYDPFSGSGTTLKEAHLQKRNWIGSEVSAEYCEIINKRIAPYLNQTTLL